MNTTQTVKKIGIFVLAYFLVIGLCVYISNLPQLITGNYSLVNEYYYTNWKTSIVMDFVFIVLYGLVAYAIWTGLNITNLYYQCIVLILTTGLLTLFFWWYYTKDPIDDKSFFSRWFHTVSWPAAIYDMVLLGTLFVVYQLLVSALV